MAPSGHERRPHPREAVSNVERPQRLRGRTTLTGDVRRPSSARRWGQISFVIKPAKIGEWGRNSFVGGSKLVLETKDQMSPNPTRTSISTSSTPQPLSAASENGSGTKFVMVY